MSSDRRWPEKTEIDPPQATAANRTVVCTSTNPSPAQMGQIHSGMHFRAKSDADHLRLCARSD